MNPFHEVIVSDPWRAAAVDVPEIQKAVFDECLSGIEHVRLSKRSAALLIHGGAGAGKTHLLSRLRAHLTLKAPTATDRDECLFVWVRLQASPRMIWREWKDIRKIFDVSPFTLSPSTKPDKSGTVPVIEAPLILSVSSVMR